MKERVLIFGNGFIGNLYLQHFKNIGIDALMSAADITNKQSLSEEFFKYEPTVVINTAAKTNLEWCALNKLATFNSNVLGADNLAEMCDKNKVYFIHFSSGCIFQSRDAYDAKKEGDTPEPGAYYSWTKVWSEELVPFERSSSFKYLILRPRQPVSAVFNYKNMLVKMLTFQKFIDTPNAGTVLEDLMEWTEYLLKEKPVGVLHAANEGWSTPYRIGLLLKKYILPRLEIDKITKDELDLITPNKRVDTVLNVDKLKSMGLKVLPYEERLEQLVQELAENIKKMPVDERRVQINKTLEQSRSRTVVNDVWQDLLKL